MRYFYWELLTYFLFLRAVVNIPIQTLIIPPWARWSSHSWSLRCLWSNLPFENYTDCLLSHGLCSKFCSSLSWLSMDFFQPTCHPSFNNYPQRSRRSSSKLLFTVHTVNSVTYGKHAFSFSAPILWNSLPDSVKNTTSLSSFKSSLKTFLFRKFCFWFILRVTVPSFHVT